MGKHKENNERTTRIYIYIYIYIIYIYIYIIFSVTVSVWDHLKSYNKDTTIGLSIFFNHCSSIYTYVYIYIYIYIYIKRER